MNFIEFSEIFAWPLCFLLIAVVFMFIFRKQIADVISRISKIEKMGVSMTRLGEQQEKKKLTRKQISWMRWDLHPL